MVIVRVSRMFHVLCCVVSLFTLLSFMNYGLSLHSNTVWNKRFDQISVGKQTKREIKAISLDARNILHTSSFISLLF